MLSAQLSHDLKLMSLVVESVRENGQQVDVLNISVSCDTCIFPREIMQLSISVMKTHQNPSLCDHLPFKFQTNLLALRHRELRLLGLKFGQVLTLLTVSKYAFLLKQSFQNNEIVTNPLCVVCQAFNAIINDALKFQYLDITIQQMCEAWEDILMEMDSKLMKFADEKQKVCGGSVSNDFLRLLMVGKPRCLFFFNPKLYEYI